MQEVSYYPYLGLPSLFPEIDEFMATSYFMDNSESSDIVESSESYRDAIVDELVLSCRGKTRYVTNVFRNLSQMMKDHPDLIRLKVSDSGSFRIEFHRRELIKVLNEKRSVSESAIILTSFERGLKHNGFTVSQTTYNHEIKIFERDVQSVQVSRTVKIPRNKKKERGKKRVRVGEDNDEWKR